MILCSKGDKSKQETSGCSEHFSTSNKCVHTKQQATKSSCSNVSLLYEQFSTCYLEDAKCFGPSMYDDIIALYKSRWNTARTASVLPNIDHCTVIPRDDSLYDRFHDWPVVTPMKVDCEDHSNATSCFNSSDNNMMYFEYCNVVEEDYDSCNACTGSNSNQDNKKCDGECTKIIKPLPSGWTTFVVSASIPYNHTSSSSHVNKNDASSTCGHNIHYSNETGVACFLQRIEIYYPEDCPYCHSCPRSEERRVGKEC